MGGEVMPTVTRRSSGERWSNADLLFLASALDRGMSLADTAGKSEEGVDRSDLTTEEAASQRQRRPDPESPESAYESTSYRPQGQGRRATDVERGC